MPFGESHRIVIVITPGPCHRTDTHATIMPAASSEVPFSASPHLCEVLECLGEEKIAPAGSFLFRRGEVCHGVFVVKSGSVRLSVHGHDSRLERTASAGSILGLPAIMAGRPYSLTAEVLDEARIVAVSRHLVLQSLEQNPELCVEVLGLLSREVQQLRERL